GQKKRVEISAAKFTPRAGTGPQDEADKEEEIITSESSNPHPDDEGATRMPQQGLGAALERMRPELVDRLRLGPRTEEKTSPNSGEHPEITSPRGPPWDAMRKTQGGPGSASDAATTQTPTPKTADMAIRLK
ncbi:unnamed protein product, partial [Prorocentrum cordatum]